MSASYWGNEIDLKYGNGTAQAISYGGKYTVGPYVSVHIESTVNVSFAMDADKAEQLANEILEAVKAARGEQ